MTAVVVEFAAAGGGPRGQRLYHRTTASRCHAGAVCKSPYSLIDCCDVAESDFAGYKAKSVAAGLALVNGRKR